MKKKTPVQSTLIGVLIKDAPKFQNLMYFISSLIRACKNKPLAFFFFFCTGLPIRIKIIINCLA